MSSIIRQIMFNIIYVFISISGDFHLNISVQNYINFTVRGFDRSCLPSLITTTKNCLTECGSFIKLTFKSSHVARKAQEFSISANVIVLFLLWVMKDVVLICLMTTLPQFG